ncbi:MAG: MarR family winged helix-turn-helix transcriptional regulator [Alteraurantiacibacter sp.]
MTHPAPPRTYEELERYLPYLVNRLATLGQATQNRLLADSSNNLVTLRTLSILRIENGLTINEIAARTFTEQSSTSRAVEAMVSQGLVERRTPPHDQRRREVILTEKGHQQLADGWPAMDYYFEAVGKGISAEERDQCRAILLRMLENLNDLNR